MTREQKRYIVALEFTRYSVTIEYDTGWASRIRLAINPHRYYAAIRLGNSESFKTAYYVPFYPSNKLPYVRYELKGYDHE